MRSFLSIAAFSLLAGANAVVVTKVDYFTQYAYQEIEVYVDKQGVPYKTVTATSVSTAAETSPEPATSSVAQVTTSAAAVTTSPANQNTLSHSHQPNNYNIIDATSSSSVAAPVTTSPSAYVPPTTSSTAPPPPPPTTSSAPAPPPTTSSSTAAAPVTTSSIPPPPPTTSSSVAPPPVTTSWEAPTTSTAPAPSPSSNDGSGSSSGQFSGAGTFYEVGLGACGVTNSDSELIAALNHEQWDQFGSMSNGNPACGKQAKLNYQGKSVTVTIQDKCPGCKYGDLDLSPAAFQKLADESVGRIQMTWSFV